MDPIIDVSMDATVNPAVVLGLPHPAALGESFRFQPAAEPDGYFLVDSEMPPTRLASLPPGATLLDACRAAVWLSIASPTDAAHVLGVFDGEQGPGRRPGSFTTLIIKAAAAADTENAFRLAMAFPGIVAAVCCWQNVHGSPDLLAARARTEP